jgi:ribose-phosphate pyrophosphokinase
VPKRDVPVVIAGRWGLRLGEEIAWGLGGYLHPVKVERFLDGEIGIELEASVRNRHVFVVQTMSVPVHESLMELVLLVDACRRASAGKITLVVPYLAYSRQDRKARPRSPISAKVIARMLETVGADRLITFDLHSGQVQGFYEIPCDNLPGAAVLAPVVKKTLMGDNVCVVATDVGGMDRARKFAARLMDEGEGEMPLAVVDKRRLKANEVPSAAVVGKVQGMHCILVDDMIDTAGTLTAAVGALRSAGASAVSMVATHGLFNGDAVRRVAGAGLQNLWLTDTYPISEDIKGLRGVTVVTVAALLVMVIKRIVEGDSLEEIYG